jgi:vacuolar-type H+-ATPase subunit C/Vma6
MAATDLPLVARAKGVATHLLSRAALESLAAAGDVASLARGLRRLGADIDPIGDAPDVAAIDLAAGRTAARHLRTLARWQRRRPGALDVFAADQDRRALRALLRGAIQGAPAARRLDGLWPTSSLPQRALAELAHQPSAGAVVKQLMWLRYPDAPRLLPLVRPAHPDLLAIEVALLQGFADRAVTAARRDRHLRDLVCDYLDLGNAQNALLLAGGPRDVTPGVCFVAGGRSLTRPQFVAVASSGSVDQALTLLRAALQRSPLAPSLPVIASEAARMEGRFLVSELARLRNVARREPLSTAALLWVLLRLEAQTRDLRALAWGAALGTPPGLLRQELVTPS